MGFLVAFKSELKTLLTHHFIAKSQAAYFRDAKLSTAEGEFVVSLDFSENYTFEIQDAIQSHHWANTQATVHPYVIYFRSNGEQKHLNFVVISEKLTHDAHSVDLFNKKLHTYLSLKFGEEYIKKIAYFSDGAGSQYKNKYNFFNLALQKTKLRIKCEWNFFATSHGKGACDGLGGALKRQAYRASLQRPNNNFLQSPVELFNWAKTFFTNIQFEFCSLHEHIEHEKDNETRFSNTITIKSTQKYHQFIPMDNFVFHCKFYSDSETVFENTVAKNK